MAISFPLAPSINDVFTTGSISYKWDGTTWLAYNTDPGAGAWSSVDINNLADVDTTNNTPMQFDVLTWTANNSWEPQISSGGGGGGGGVTNLSGLTDVTTSGLADNDFLRFNVNTLLWEPESASDLASDINLSMLSNVTSASPSDGDILSWNDIAQEWNVIQPTSSITSSVLSDLSDVSTNAPTAGQILVWDQGSTEWAPQDPSPIPDTLDDLSNVAPNPYGTAANDVLTWRVNGALQHWMARPIDWLDSGDLADVDITTNSPNLSDTLTWTANNIWEPQAGGGGGGGSSSLSGLTDVAISNPSANHKLSYNPVSSAWENELDDLSSLNDVTLDGNDLDWQVLRYNQTTNVYENDYLPLTQLSDVETVNFENDWDVLRYNQMTNRWENDPFPLTRCSDVIAFSPNVDDVLAWTANNTWEPQISSGGGSGGMTTAVIESAAMVEIIVKVATKTAEHPHYGQGSSLGYTFTMNGVELQSPYLDMVPGKTYRFNQEDSSNATHPLKFYLEYLRHNLYETDVTYVGTPGQAGAYTEIIAPNLSRLLYYACQNHSLMGGQIQVKASLPFGSVQVGNRVVATYTTNSLAANSGVLIQSSLPTMVGSGYTEIDSFYIYGVETSHDAWVKTYSSITARDNDLRTIDQDPAPGIGLTLETIHRASDNQLDIPITPGVFHWNADNTGGQRSNLYFSVTNLTSSSQTIVVQFKIFPLEFIT